MMIGLKYFDINVAISVATKCYYFLKEGWILTLYEMYNAI